MVLNLVGLGLSGAKDISLKGLEAVRQSDEVLLENYTSVIDTKDFELFGTVKVCDRNDIENGMEKIVERAKNKTISVLVMGDVFSATTHINYTVECKKQNVEFKVFNNASVMNAIGVCGLSLYKFGKTASMPFQRSIVPYEILKVNKQNGMHTLILLDLDTDNKSFMRVNEAINRMVELEREHKQQVFTPKTKIVGMARVGWSDQIIKYGPAKVVAQMEFGKAPHCIAVPAKMHFAEEEALEVWK